MNKYKIVSLFLALALVASLVHLVAVHGKAGAAATAPAAVDTKAVVLGNILQRKSVRSFTDRPVSREQIDTLLRAAMAAPTGKNLQPWKFVVVERRETLDALQRAWPRAGMLAEAQAAVLVCGDDSIVDADGKPSVNWEYDCCAATENLLLMAEAMGLGAVWVGVSPYPERVEAIKAALALPAELTPLNLIPIGYPKGEPSPKDKYKTQKIVYHDK